LSHPIAGCPYNDKWVKDAAQDDALWKTIRPHQALACGTFAGTQEAVLNLMRDVYEGCLSHPCTDQGMFNCLVRLSYKDITYVPAVYEPFSTQWWPEKRATANPPISHPANLDPVFDETSGEVRTINGEPYPIVHLYDRSPKWLQIMRRKYA
jgi:hypothetical protein